MLVDIVLAFVPILLDVLPFWLALEVRLIVTNDLQNVNLPGWVILIDSEV